MSKVVDYKNMSVVELNGKIAENRAKIIGYVVQKNNGTLKNTALIKLLKKENARMLTLLNCKK